jgi:hypothetical protein
MIVTTGAVIGALFGAKSPPEREQRRGLTIQARGRYVGSR